MGKGRGNTPYFRSLMDPARKKANDEPVMNPIKAAKAKAKAAASQAAPAGAKKGAKKNTAPPRGKQARGKKGSAEKLHQHKQPLDGEGRPYLTLVQFLKSITAVGTGGAGKHLVRSGVITVNGECEIRPARKLHDGDQVIVAGKAHTVKL